MIAPLALAAHGGNRLLGGQKEAERVDAPGALHILRLDLLDVAPGARAGVIDERVDLAEIGAAANATSTEAASATSQA